MTPRSAQMWVWFLTSYLDKGGVMSCGSVCFSTIKCGLISNEGHHILILCLSHNMPKGPHVLLFGGVVLLVLLIMRNIWSQSRIKPNQNVIPNQRFINRLIFEGHRTALIKCLQQFALHTGDTKKSHVLSSLALMTLFFSHIAPLDLLDLSSEPLRLIPTLTK